MNGSIRPQRAWQVWARGLLALGLLSGSLLAPAFAGGNDKKSGTAPTFSSKGYDYYLTGNAANAAPAAPASQLLVLMGGGTDVDAAFKAMIAKARGTAPGAKLDIVVIRASGEDGYNDYLYGMDGAVDSVETLV